MTVCVFLPLKTRISCKISFTGMMLYPSMSSRRLVPIQVSKIRPEKHVYLNKLEKQYP